MVPTVCEQQAEASTSSGARLGIDRANFFTNLDPETERVVEEALRHLEDVGAVLVEMEVAHLQEAPLI